MFVMKVLHLDEPDSISIDEGVIRGGVIGESICVDEGKGSGTGHPCRKACSSRSERWR